MHSLIKLSLKQSGFQTFGLYKQQRITTSNKYRLWQDSHLTVTSFITLQTLEILNTQLV